MGNARPDRLLRPAQNVGNNRPPGASYQVDRRRRGGRLLSMSPLLQGKDGSTVKKLLALMIIFSLVFLTTGCPSATTPAKKPTPPATEKTKPEEKQPEEKKPEEKK